MADASIWPSQEIAHPNGLCPAAIPCLATSTANCMSESGFMAESPFRAAGPTKRGLRAACNILRSTPDYQLVVGRENLGKTLGLWYTVRRPMVRVAVS